MQHAITKFLEVETAKPSAYCAHLLKSKKVATRNKKLLGAPGIATRSKDATCLDQTS